MIDYATFDFAHEAALAVDFVRKQEPNRFKDRFIRAVWLDHEGEVWNVNGTASERFSVARNVLLASKQEKKEISW